MSDDYKGNNLIAAACEGDDGQMWLLSEWTRQTLLACGTSNVKQTAMPLWKDFLMLQKAEYSQLLQSPRPSSSALHLSEKICPLPAPVQGIINGRHVNIYAQLLW